MVDVLYFKRYGLISVNMRGFEYRSYVRDVRDVRVDICLTSYQRNLILEFPITTNYQSSEGIHSMALRSIFPGNAKRNTVQD
jgi:hypothetical protein